MRRRPASSNPMLRVGLLTLFADLGFANASDFFSAVKPPFFESYDVAIVDSSDCLDGAATAVRVPLALAAVAALLAALSSKFVP